MFEAFSLIAGTHPQSAQFKDEYVEGWSRDDNTKVVEFMSCLTRFKFIIGAVSLYSLLHPLHGLTQKLQGRTKDIVDAYQGVEEIIGQLKSMREKMEDTYLIPAYTMMHVGLQKNWMLSPPSPEHMDAGRNTEQMLHLLLLELQEQSWHPGP